MIDAKAVRLFTGLTQAEFAERYGIALGTLRNWEQSRYSLSQADRLLLNLIMQYPLIVAAVAEDLKHEEGL